jgi:DNA-3-methyladenine glycosylase I
MHPPKPENDAGFLATATRIIFMGGLNRQVVDSKWDGFLRAFQDFDVDQVAGMSPADIERLASDDSVIRYAAKLQAVVDNAQEMQAIAEMHGSFRAWVDEIYASRGVDGATKELASRFKYISRDGARNWLYATGYDVGDVSEKVMRKYGVHIP